MRVVELEQQMGEDGRIPHRTVLPLDMPRWFDENPRSHVYAADGRCGAILKLYREVRNGAGEEFLRRMWRRVKAAMEYAIRTWDPDQDGVFDGPQWNTYDCYLYGHSTITTGLYLAALRAAERMAILVGDSSFARVCRNLYTKGRSNVDQILWNGEYYEQAYDEAATGEMQYGSGCHSDQLIGQWWANLLDLGYILPRTHIRKAVRSIYRYNFRRELKEHVQQPRKFLREDESGLLVCTWPRGGRPPRPTLYSDEVWTGIEYEVAALLFQEGMVSEGLFIVENTRKRHDGELRSPWNEVECGDHYVRPMSSWTMIEALAGYTYDSVKREMGFDPMIKGDDFSCFFCTDSSWGLYRQRCGEAGWIYELKVAYGFLDLESIKLPVRGRVRLRPEAYIAGEKIEADFECRRRFLLVRGKLRVEKGETLKILV